MIPAAPSQHPHRDPQVQGWQAGWQLALQPPQGPPATPAWLGSQRRGAGGRGKGCAEEAGRGLVSEVLRAPGPLVSEVRPRGDEDSALDEPLRGGAELRLRLDLHLEDSCLR